MKSYLTISDDYLVKVIKINPESKPPPFFSLSPLKKNNYYQLGPYNFQFITNKDHIAPITNPSISQFQLKLLIDQSYDAFSLIVNEAFSIKFENCSLNVVDQFIKKFFVNPGVSAIRKLKLINCEINDRFIEVLMNNSNYPNVLSKITHFSLKNCSQLTEKSIRCLISCPYWKALSHLNLNHMNLDEDALCALAYSDLIKSLKTLKLLDLKATNFSKGLRELFNPNQIPMLKNLQFSEDSQDSDRKSFNKYGFQYISNSLEKLYFQGDGAIDTNKPKISNITDNNNINDEKKLIINGKTSEKAINDNKTEKIDLKASKYEIITWHNVRNYHYSNLKSLSLRCCILTENFFKVLENSYFLEKLENLDFSSCFYKRKTLKALEKFLLSSKLENLKTLDLSFSNIADSTLTLISETMYMGSLEVLQLNNCNFITNQGINRLIFSEKRTKNLRVMTLHHTKISDDTVYNLAYRLEISPIRRIISLDFSGCEELSSHCLNYLLKNEKILSLEQLKLAKTNINDFALESISESHACLDLKKLDLSSCSLLTSKGFIQFFDKFQGKIMMHLKLRQCSIDDDGVKNLVKNPLIIGLEKLKLNGCKRITKTGFEALYMTPNFKRLRILSLIGTAVDDDILQGFANSKSLVQNLRRLNLMQCKLISKLSDLFTDKHIFMINFDWNFLINQFRDLVDDAHLEKYGKYEHNGIRKIVLDGMSRITSQGFIKLLSGYNWQALESISLEKTRIDGIGLKYLFFQKKLVNNMKILTYIHMRGNNFIDDQSLIDIFKFQGKTSHMPKNLCLDEFLFKEIRLKDEIIDNVDLTKNITVIDLTGQTLIGTETFRKLFDPERNIISEISKLILDKTNIEDSNILNYLKTAKNLKIISFNNCPFIKTKALNYLCTNPYLADDFDLRCLLKQDQLIDDSFLKALSESRYLNNLRFIDLNSNRLISEIGIEYLCNSKNLGNVKKLDLSQTFLNDSALEALSKGIFLSLDRINLCDCPRITSKGLKYIILSGNFSRNFDIDQFLMDRDVRLKIDEELIKALIDSPYIGNLKRLKFKGILESVNKLTLYELLRKTAKYLEEIDIRKTNFDEELLEVIAEENSLKALKTLKMDDSIGSDEFNGIKKLTHDNISIMNKYLDSLEIKFEQYRDRENLPSPSFIKPKHEKEYNDEKKKINEETLANIKKNLKLAQLKLLDKQYFKNFDMEYYLFSEQSSVNDLALQFLASKFFDVFTQNFSSDLLKTLEIPDPKSSLKTLKYLNFNGNLNITHQGLSDLVTCPEISGLEILDVSNTKIDDRAILAIANSDCLKNLKNLFFLNSPYITANSLNYLIKSSKLPNINLQMIFRLFSHWIDDEIIKNLSDSLHLSKISILYLNKSKITSKSFISLKNSSHSGEIRCIELSEAYLIGDDSLEIIANSSIYKEHLREINMSKTPLISANGLITLLKSECISSKFDMFKIILKQKLDILTGPLLLAFIESPFWLSRVRKIKFSQAVLLTSQDFIDFFEKLMIKKHVFYEISLEKTNINDKFLKTVSKLPIINELRFLNLNRCPYISAQGLSAFFGPGSQANMSILQIRFDATLIRKSLISAIIPNRRFLDRFQVLDLSRNLYLNNECLSILLTSPSIIGLKSLDISFTNIDANGIIEIANCEGMYNLIDLNLQGLALNSDCLCSLCKSETLGPFFQIEGIFEKLENKALITDDVVDYLSQNVYLLKELVHLDISHSDVSSLGLSKLANSDFAYNLEILDISNTEIDDIGIISLAKKDKLLSLKKLIFNNCMRITKISIKYLTNTNQNIFFSWKNILETPTQRNIVDYPTLKSLTLNKSYIAFGEDNHFVLPAGFKFKKPADFEGMLNNGSIFWNLQEIRFESNPSITDEMVFPILQCEYLRDLRKIYIKGCPITDKLLLKFSKPNKFLINFELASIFQDNELLLTDEILENLYDSIYLSQFHHFSLKDNKLITCNGFQSLSNSPFAYNIETFDLSNSNIDDKSLEKLANSKFLINLKEIDFRGCQFVSFKGIKTLVESNALSCWFSLDFVFRQLFTENIENDKKIVKTLLCDELLQCLSRSHRLKYLKKLKLYYRNEEITEKSVSQLFSNPSIVNLKVIDLSGSVISNKIIENITKNLKYLRSLKDLDLKDTTGYTSDSISRLFESMTPPYQNDEMDNSEGYFRYKILKKSEDKYTIIPKKFLIQKFLDTVILDHKIFESLKYCPLFYKARHFKFMDLWINQTLLKDLVCFQQSRNMKKIIINSDNIDPDTAEMISKSKILIDLETLELPNMKIDSLSSFIKTSIVSSDYEPFSLFKNTYKDINDKILVKIAEWEKLLNTKELILEDNNTFTGTGIANLLSTPYSCQLIELNLSGTKIDNKAIEAICYNEHLPRLHKLRVERCPNLSSQSLMIICEDDKNHLSPFFNYNFPFKDLRHRINDSVAQKLNKSKKIMPFLTELDLSQNIAYNINDKPVSKESLRTLISNTNLNILQKLAIDGADYDDDFLIQLSKLDHLLCLISLRLNDPKVVNLVDSQENVNKRFSSKGIASVFSAKFSDYFKIRDFIIDNKSYINDEVCISMRSSLLLRNLSKLELSHATFSSQGILEILQNDTLLHLNELDLSYTKLDNETFAKLSTVSGFKNVYILKIEGCKDVNKTQYIKDFFDGNYLNDNFNFQGFFNELLEKFDGNFITFSNIFLKPLSEAASRSIVIPKAEDAAVINEVKEASTASVLMKALEIKNEKSVFFNEKTLEKEESRDKKLLLTEEFFDGFLKTKFFKEKLMHMSLTNYRYFDKVALKFFDNVSARFDISEFLFSLPLKMQRLVTDTHIKKIVDNFNHIKYIQLKSLINVTYGINYLLKAPCEEKFELAFKAQYIKKKKVQQFISADSLQKFIDDAFYCPEFFAFFTEINFSENRFLSALHQGTQKKWQEMNEIILKKISQEMPRWEVKTNKETINKNKSIVFPDGKSPTSVDFKHNFKEVPLEDITIMRIKGQRINLIDDHIQVNILLPFLKKCSHLKILDLSYQNIGDSFLKEFTMELNNITALKTLRELNLSENTRITSVGLKYLYTSVYHRAGKLVINLGKDPHELLGLIYPNLPNSNNKILSIDKKPSRGDFTENVFKSAFLKNLDLEANRENESSVASPVSRTSLKKMMKLSINKSFFVEYQMFLTTLMIYGMFETINKLFNQFWNQHYIIMVFVMIAFLPFTLFHLYKLSLFKITKKIENLLKSEDLKKSFLISMLKTCFNCLNFLYKSLIKCKFKTSKNEKQLQFLKNYEKNVFYFDDDVAFLNSVLSFRSYRKLVKKEGETRRNQEESTYHYRPFYLRFFTYFILIDFCIYYAYVIIYPTSYEIGCTAHNEPSKSIVFDVPYYIYALVSFFCEAIFLNEISNIMNSKDIFVMFSIQNLLTLISTQTARYDLYTDINFMVLLFRCNNTQDLAIASLVIIIINLFFTFYIFLKTYFTMYYRYKSSDNKEKDHPTFFLNSYTQLAFTLDYQGLGSILDRFSTKSASIIRSKFAPSFLRGIYFPSAMISRFQRMLLENIPLIIIQLIFMARNGLNPTDFTQMKTFITTLISIISSLNRVWDAKPSLFQREIFKSYYEILEETFKRKEEKMIIGDFQKRKSIRKAINLEEIPELEEVGAEEKNHQDVQKIVAQTVNENGSNRKVQSIMIDNDDELEHGQYKPFLYQEFKLNPILMNAKEDFRDSITTINDKNEKNSVFGGLTFHSKDSEQEDLLERSPDTKKKT